MNKTAFTESFLAEMAMCGWFPGITSQFISEGNRSAVQIIVLGTNPDYILKNSVKTKRPPSIISGCSGISHCQGYKHNQSIVLNLKRMEFYITPPC